jgi:hypothetical protein
MSEYSVEQINGEKKAERENGLRFGADSIKAAWKAGVEDRTFRLEVALTVPGLVLTLAMMSNFLERVESRPGMDLADPLLAMFSPINATVPTFLILYVSLVIAVFFVLQDPRHLLIGTQAYIVLALLRCLAIYLTPLDHPANMILLKDPIIEFFGGGRPFTKDLFFSGHTSLMFLLYLTARKKWLATIFLAGTVIVGVCLIAQHVHYTMDVLCAPFMAYASLRIVKLTRSKAVLRYIS